MPRPDVLAALVTLRDREAHRAWLAGEQTWPDLANAIHWLIDDTWWDDHPVTDDVGTLVRSKAEAEAVQQSVDLLLRLIEDIEPTDNDGRYVSHARWDSLVKASEHALRVLSEPGALQAPSD